MFIEYLKSFQKRRRKYPISTDSEALDKIENQLWGRAMIEKRVIDDDEKMFRESFLIRSQNLLRRLKRSK